MRDIKEKSVDHSIKSVDQKFNIDYYMKKSEVNTRDKISNKNEKENSAISSPNHQAIDCVVKREKRTVAQSIYYVNKHMKNKKATLQIVKTKELLDNNEIIEKNVFKNGTQNIKKNNAILRERTVSRKLQYTSEVGKKNNYSLQMKRLGMRKHQKKMKEATQKTSTILQRSSSAVGNSIKVTFKAVTKVATSIQNLLSIGGALVLLVVITLFIGIFASLSSDSGIETATEPISEEVMAYTDLIYKYAQQYDISDYVTLIQAVMMKETKGLGTDPMQASEYEYNTKYANKPNGIKDAEYSIDVGVHYLADCMKQSKVKEPYDIQKISLALQGYDFKKEYIDWAMANFNGYTRANAKVYNDEMIAKLQVTSYGNPQYVPEVLQYYRIGNGKIVDVALSQVGNIGGKTFWSWYGFDYRVEWCACFVSWCANQAGLIENGKIPKFAYCPTGIQWFKERNLWLERGKVPQPGYIIFFDWQGDGISDHVGIVERIEGGMIYTIEGNSDKDECRKKNYSIMNKVIVGYGIVN